MKGMVSAAESVKPRKGQMTVLLAEGDKTLGHLPTGWEAGLLREILSRQSAKTLPEAEIRSGKEGDLLVLQIPAKKGLGFPDRLKVAQARMLDILKSRAVHEAVIPLESAEAADLAALAEAVHVVSYEFKRYKSEKKDKAGTAGGKAGAADPGRDLRLVYLRPKAALKRAEADLRRAEILGRRINAARDLVNLPGSDLDPAAFAAHCRKEAREAGLTVRVRDEKDLEKEGFLGTLTVGKGSDRPPRMVTLTYDGRAKRAAAAGARGASGAPRSERGGDGTHLVLVGKGITFDTGGISIKPAAGMWEMKGDMAGAATAFSALMAMAELGLPLRASAVLCMAENRPGNRSVLPGDIFRAKNGKTVMVDNTDAEGRLALSDGLFEAGTLGATHIVDLATLTGAIIRALGPAIAGLFCNDDALSAALLEAGRKEGEKFCRLPLEAEYRDQLDDTVADLKNIGKPEGGAITAGLFLEEFVPPGTPWAHLDIAGTAFTTAPWKHFRPGPTGWGVKTLVALAEALA